MARRSNKSVEAIILASHNKDDIELDRKITLAIEAFTTKSSELILRDRNRLSNENALIVSNYIIAMKREINPRLSYIKHTIEFLSELSKSVGIEKRFEDMTREDVLLYLDSNRKSENDDPLHKWIGTYNTKRIVLMRFFKWLFYSNIANPDKRNELSKSDLVYSFTG
jgi:hypothetical protein